MSKRRADVFSAIDNAENKQPSKPYGGMARPEFFDAINETPADDIRVQELESKLAQLQNLESAVNSGGAVVLGRCTMTPVGLNMPSDLSIEEWNQIGETLFQLEGSLQWMIGDWLAFAEKAGYGEAKAIAEKIGKNPGTLYNWAWVSRQLPEFSYRYEVLSHTHHQVVVSMVEPEHYNHWLSKAAEGDLVDEVTGERKVWSVARLKIAIQGNSNQEITERIEKWWSKIKTIADKAANYKKAERQQLATRLRQLADELEKG